MSQDANRRYFLIGFFAAEALSLVSLILVGIWTGKHLGGFSWQSDPRKEFNLHPLLMVIGLIVLHGNGMLIYRLMRYYDKTVLKLMHAFHFAGAFICAVVALKAVFDSHDLREKPTANMYSLHSWIGLGAVIIFTAQFLFGILLYLLPFAPRHWKQLFMPSHRYFGIAIYLLSIASCLTGITEKIIFRIGGKEYQKLPVLAVIGNALSVVLVVLALIVVFLVANPDHRRRPSSEENIIELKGYQN